MGSVETSGHFISRHIDNAFDSKTHLLDVTIILLHAHQQSQSLWRRWSLVGGPQPFCYDSVHGYQLSAVAYGGNLVPAIRLIKPTDYIRPLKGKYIFCIFGCKVQSDHKWLCNQTYLSLCHFLISLIDIEKHITINR